MIETAEDKTTLPAMDRVFQHLEAGEQRPLTFVSASPSFFERVLERKMVLDGIEHDGIALKKFGNVIFSDLLDFDPGSIVADLENQIGYKLVTLLQLRAELPASMPEVLLGDDSEADFVVYNLYDRLLRHELDVTELDALLEALTVNHHWREQIAARLPEVLAEDPAPPLVLYVRATDQGSGHFAYEEWERPTMHRHAGTWALALDLFEESLLDESAVLDIRDGLFEQGLSASDLAAEADAAAFVDPDTAEQFR
jgi:hypothetical protein